MSRPTERDLSRNLSRDLSVDLRRLENAERCGHLLPWNLDSQRAWLSALRRAAWAERELAERMVDEYALAVMADEGCPWG